MKRTKFFSHSPFVTVLLSLSVNIHNVHSIRNLFLPRTGDVAAALPPTTVAENLSNVTNFQSLLGAGRSLAYPFAAGMLLSIATIGNENNWKVSDTGFAKILGIPREEIAASYGTLFNALETDENVTLSNMLFSLNPKFSPSELLLETLMTEVREVSWTRETWKETYKTMVEHLSNVTNEKIDRALIPPVTKVGTPFRKATQAVVLSTFHYINGWQYQWTTETELEEFEGNPGIPYMKAEGQFLVAEEDEYVAVAVPLEGRSKSIVFILPHVNITSKYFRNQAEAGIGEEDEGKVDIVPFPTKWEMRNLVFKVPTFNTTDVDQYGEELEQTGVNETFCTIIRDYYGRYPYYLRPMVQVNSLDFNEDYLELASATGVAVEKFQSLFSVVSGGVSEGDDNDDDRRQSSTGSKTITTLDTSHAPKSTNPPSPASASNSPVELYSNGPSTNSTGAQQPETGAPAIPTLTMNRPFLWYLNDSEVGPMFFGTVETLVNLAFVENSTAEPETERPPVGEEDEMGTTSEALPTTTMAPPRPNNGTTDVNDEVISDLEKYYLWSCRSYSPQNGDNKKQGEGQKNLPAPDWFIFQFEDDDRDNAITTTEPTVTTINIQNS